MLCSANGFSINVTSHESAVPHFLSLASFQTLKISAADLKTPFDA